MAISCNEAQILQIYEEAVGTLLELEESEGFLLARMSKATLYLPIEMAERLHPLIGQRIGILRTETDYRFRTFSAPAPKLGEGIAAANRA